MVDSLKDSELNLEFKTLVEPVVGIQNMKTVEMLIYYS